MTQKNKQNLYYSIFILFSAGAIINDIIVTRTVNSIAITVFMGLLALIRQQIISGRTSTVSLLTQEITDLELAQKLSKFNNLVNKNSSFSKYLEKDLLDKKGLEEREVIIYILNYYEFVAGGIREGAFDYRLFHRLYYSNIIRMWNTCETFVFELRKKSSTKNNVNIKNDCIFQEIETLAKEFHKHELKSRVNRQ